MTKQLLTGINAPTRVTSAPKTPPASIKTPMGPRSSPKPIPRPGMGAVVARPVAGRKSIQPAYPARKRNY